MAFGKSMHDAILTDIDNMDNVVMLKVAKAVKLTIGSKGHGRIGEDQNFHPMGFLRNVRNTALISAASRLDLDNELNRNDETYIIEKFQDGEFPALGPNFGRRPHANLSCTASFRVFPDVVPSRGGECYQKTKSTLEEEEGKTKQEVGQWTLFGTGVAHN